MYMCTIYALTAGLDLTVSHSYRMDNCKRNNFIGMMRSEFLYRSNKIYVLPTTPRVETSGIESCRKHPWTVILKLQDSVPNAV